MKTWGLWILGLSNGAQLEGMPCWLSEVDFDKHAPGKPYPTGSADGTDDPTKAIRFTDAGEALEFYRRVSEKVPKRADGQPNRPLMAFTIEVKELP